VAACPILAAETSRLWAGWAERRPRARWPDSGRVAADFASGFRRSSLWPAALVLALRWWGAPSVPLDFPAVKFPVDLVGRERGNWRERGCLLGSMGRLPAVPLLPRQRVFIDGRSDFYGPELGKLYLRVAYGTPSGGTRCNATG